MSDYLVGKWVNISDIEYYKTGKILAKLSDDVYVFKVDSKEGSENPLANNFQEIISLRRILMLSPEYHWTGITVFDTEEDLRTYCDWLDHSDKEEEEPKDGTIVNFRKK